MPGLRRLRLLVVALVLGAAPRLHAATVPSVFGGKIACAPSTGDVQFCAGSVATRVESFDGVPLDVNLTIPPATMDGPFPLIAQLVSDDPNGCWGASLTRSKNTARLVRAATGR